MVKELEERILAALARAARAVPADDAARPAEGASRSSITSATRRWSTPRWTGCWPASRLVGDLRRIARADFKPKLSANLRKLKDKLVAAYQEARFQPPEPASFAGTAGGNAASLKDLFEVCVAEGFLVHVAGDLYLHADADADMRRRVKERLSRQGGGLTVAEIRDLLGTTRKYAVPLCEYLDRVGVTRREGDLRRAAGAV